MAPARGKAKTPKSLSKKVQKPPVVHLTRPGFNAFKTNSRRKKGGKVSCKVVAAPETGIHSLGWSSMIEPNTSGLFKLSAEIRLRIWEYVIAAIDTPAICPRKAKDKFAPYGNTAGLAQQQVTDERFKVGKIMIGLYTLCRQAYVDIYGSALLYRIKPFYFPSPERMLNYLAVINPHHRNSITSVSLFCKLYENNLRKFASEATWPMLRSMNSLQNLDIVFIPHDILTSSRGFQHPAVIGPKYSAQIFETLKKHEELKRIRGLERFELRMTNALPVQEVELEDICEDIKKMVLLKRPASVSDQ